MPAKTDRDVARAWVRVQQNWWAFDSVHGACESHPRRALRLLDAICARATTPMLVRDLGCGPLEDFVRIHAQVFIAQIEGRCAANPRFRKALSYAWLPRADDDVSRRLLALGMKPIEAKIEVWQRRSRTPRDSRPRQTKPSPSLGRHG
ncbi:hypothetical protein K2Z84_24795 [Candidatus Binatia bacterium]|nr:hypothetical protein [Candidatus Binatia bacterium]